MKRDYIDFRLFPDIVYNGDRYSNYNDSACQMMADVNIPFLRAYNNAKENQKLLLIGDGSLGKSTSLRVFEAEMLIKKIPCLFYECKSINANDISMIEAHVMHHSNEIIIFDAYDELQDTMREAFNDLIDKMNNYENRVIISSRFDPRSGYISEATSEVFSTYQSMNICDFTDKQLDSLVSKTISRNGGYYKLLRTTMFLALHLELEKNNLLSSLRDSIKTEACFIQQYFELLYFDKMTDEVKLSDLIHLGKYVHKQRRGKINRYLERIPNPLKHIFDYGVISVSDDKNLETHLISHQVKYLNYLHALYLKEQLLSLYEDTNIEEFTFSAQRLLNMPSTSEISESVYYAGQLLAEQSEIKSILIALNQDETKKQTRYENILCLFLGYNHDIAEDIPGVFNFFHPIMTDNYHDYLHVCDRIRELKANSIREIHFGYSGFPQLEKISIENDIYYSKGNCLIKRSDNGLFIGCQNSEIPEGVLYIHSHAFSYCDIRRVVLPPSVREVDRFAFKYCEFLEYVELGESVNKLARDSFYKCSAIKTICIKNKAMQIGHSFYDVGAFVRVPVLEEVIVPTTGVLYMYKIAPNTLSVLDVSQGKIGNSLVPLTFEGVIYTNKFKKLIIRKDVTNIAEDSFMFQNHIEEIYVEEGNTSYYSYKNCLISKKDKSIVLGCKNSVIPHSGVKRINDYAFARCGISSVQISKEIESIGRMAFYRCNNLKDISISSSLRVIDVDAFNLCKNLTKVLIEDVDQWAQVFFATIKSNPLIYAKSLQCNQLSNKVLKLSEGVSDISSGAFKDCAGIEEIVIPSSIKSIGGCAFYNCNDIKAVHIKDVNSYAKICFNSFSSNPLWQGARLYVNKEEATSIIFNKNLFINKHAFIRTKSINSIVLSDGCEVGFESFKECPNLKQVILKSPNVKIDPTAFSGCKVEICFHGTLEEWKTLSNNEEIKGIISVSFL